MGVPGSSLVAEGLEPPGLKNERTTSVILPESVCRLDRGIDTKSMDEVERSTATMMLWRKRPDDSGLCEYGRSREREGY